MPVPTSHSGYSPIDADPPRGGFGAHLLELAEELRTEGVAIGTSEMLDAFEAIAHVPWTNQVDFKEALAATLAKSPDDRRVFELVFDRFFFRAAEAQAARREVGENSDAAAEAGELNASDINLDTLRQQIAQALRDGSDAAMRDLARLAIAAFGRGRDRACSVSTCSGFAGRSACVPSPNRSFPRTTLAAPDCPGISCAGSNSICAASSSAT